MWDAISNVASAVGNAAYSTGAYVGLVGPGVDNSNLPSAYPFKEPKSKEEKIDLCQNTHYQEFIRVMDGSEWGLVDFTDPEAKEGGDIKLWTRPQDGTHHFIKATFIVQNVAPAKAAALVASESVEERQKFGPNMEVVNFFEKVDDNTKFLYTKFWAPPPIAARDFVFLQGTKHFPDGTIEIWGCSVTNPTFPEEGYVRGASFWGWRFRPLLDHVQTTYFNVSDPRGWCPSFIFSYLKTQVVSDLVAIRAVLTGKAVHAQKITVQDCGVTEEELKKEEEAFKSAQVQKA
eukprot:PhF_6_TR39055/c0_g1_i1/m.58447